MDDMNKREYTGKQRVAGQQGDKVQGTRDKGQRTKD